jgi:hypothetical protein
MPGSGIRSRKTTSGWRNARYLHSDGTMYPCQVISGPTPPAYTVRVMGLRRTFSGVLVATAPRQTGRIYRV